MAEEHSFALQVKEELAHMSAEQDCCQRMELAGLLRALGTVELQGGGRLALSLSTDSSPVARKVIRLVRAHYPIDTRVLVMRRRQLRKNLVYWVQIPHQDGLREMLVGSGLTDQQGRLQEWIDLPELAHDHCRRAYLRGTFLGTGWIASPDRQHHLEMVTQAMEAADALGQLLFSYNISVRMLYRKESLVLYLKEAEQIARFLNVVGAHEALMRYEDIRALKEMKNLVNRQVNAETANLAKTAEASARQVEALERLQASGRLEGLSSALRELALLRLEHPDASLKELGELCHPPVGKSGVAHRMRLLMNLAAE